MAKRITSMLLVVLLLAGMIPSALAAELPGGESAAETGREESSPEEETHPEISKEDAWTLAKQYAFSGGQIENIARKQIVNSILFPEESRDLNKIRQACDSEYLNKNQNRPIGFC